MVLASTLNIIRKFLKYSEGYIPEEYAGTGIGLAICKRLIDGHNGRKYRTEPEKGVTFISPSPSRAWNLF